MPEKDIIAKGLKIKQKSVFDMGELYKIMIRWFSQHNYDFQEKEYLEKVEAAGKHLEIKWVAARKISDYIKFQIEIKFLILGLSDVEITLDKLTRKSNKGELEMRFDAILIMDYLDKWVNKPLIKFLREIYNKTIIRSRIEQYKEELSAEVYELMGEVKAFLNLYKFQNIEPG